MDTSETPEMTCDAVTHATLYGVKNDQGTVTEPCKPWSFVPSVPDFGADKTAYKKWRNQASTEHLCYLAGEGQNPNIRPNKRTNPVAYLNCIIADYDSDITEKMQAGWLESAPVDLQANWISKTFSNGRRLVWLFEKPASFDDYIAKRFFEVAGKQLRVSSLLPGLDKPAWEKMAYHLFDVGTDWEHLSAKPLSSSIV